MRVGIGFDIHRLAEGDGVILGGVTLPFHKKLVGHSDADALCHAIIDALLGAAGLGDIGGHFPDTDPKYKGASSIDLLSQVAEEIRSAGFGIGNVDAIVIAQAPRISEYKNEIEIGIANALGIDRNHVSVKGKTAEGLGPVGATDAICTQAVALVEEMG
jgi:2-C-methyl-D-erythritol 2,4-cyclodiphosphate synthase